eukprot:6210829-Pleurochrysis_carterae.AAC.4
MCVILFACLALHLDRLCVRVCVLAYARTGASVNADPRAPSRDDELWWTRTLFAWLQVERHVPLRTWEPCVAVQTLASTCNEPEYAKTSTVSAQACALTPGVEAEAAASLLRKPSDGKLERRSFASRTLHALQT